MDRRSPSFEASLLYKDASLPALDPLLDDLRAVIDINGETLRRTDHVDEMFTVLTCDSVQVLLAFSPESLPAVHFLNSGRPGAASMGESQILTRLQHVQAMVTVLVIDREASAILPEAKLKRNLCWDVTDCLFQASPAELVFWTDTDVLYAAEEFERSCTYLAHQPDRSEDGDDVSDAPDHRPDLPSDVATEPDDAASVREWLTAQPAAAPEAEDTTPDSMPRSRLRRVLSRALPARLMTAMRRAQQCADRREPVRRSASGNTTAIPRFADTPERSGQSYVA